MKIEPIFISEKPHPVIKCIFNLCLRGKRLKTCQKLDEHKNEQVVMTFSFSMCDLSAVYRFLTRCWIVKKILSSTSKNAPKIGATCKFQLCHTTVFAGILFATYGHTHLVRLLVIAWWIFVLNSKILSFKFMNLVISAVFLINDN